MDQGGGGGPDFKFVFIGAQKNEAVRQSIPFYLVKALNPLFTEAHRCSLW